MINKLYISVSKIANSIMNVKKAYIYKYANYLND